MSAASDLSSLKLTKSASSSNRNDTTMLWAGIIFSAAFTGLIWLMSPLLDDVRATLLPDSGASWYYWRLPVENFAAKATAWGFYFAHQVALWWLIWKAQSEKAKYSGRLHWFNWAAFGVNVVFILLHLLQTHVWYDALAQDVSIWSSQASVVIMLCVILLMENSRRGLFWGTKAPMSQRVISFARTYHGYLFSWAAVYTFWYHPMETTSGHLIGFFYMFFLLLQGSLFFTRIHVNRWWTFTQEFMVLVHGTLVAVYQGNGIWPMFFFGFAGLLVLTQMHGLGLSKWTKWAILFVFVALTLLVYNGRGFARIDEVIRIPLIEYLVMYVIVGLISLGLWIYDKTGGKKATLQTT